MKKGNRRKDCRYRVQISISGEVYKGKQAKKREGERDYSEEESDYDYRSRFGSERSSMMSLDRMSKVSECFSKREIDKLKKFMVEKEKEERRNNNVIKGWEIGEMITNEKAKEFIKKELDVEVRVKRSRMSGRIIVVSLEGAEMKRETMINKKRLKGKSIFIENDLTWEERKIQERINRWAKEEKEKGRAVKIGFARVMIDEIWKKWEEMEEEKSRGEKIEVSRRKEIRKRMLGEERGKERMREK